jgi:hypothetical protein
MQTSFKAYCNDDKKRQQVSKENSKVLSELLTECKSLGSGLKQEYIRQEQDLKLCVKDSEGHFVEHCLREAHLQ